MSKNQPSASAVSVQPLEHVGQHKKSKRKISRVRLPTPPPDPVQENEDAKKNQTEKDEFLEYLENLPKSHHQNLTRTNSIFAPIIATEDAFDHLEKLYKLMEQMLLLRDQNAKLHRRIRDLEHLRNLQNMHLDDTSREVNDTDTHFAETLLDTILMDTKRDPKLKQHHHPYQFRFRQSLLRRQRNRCNSMTFDKQPTDMDGLRASYRRSSALSGPEKKVSKWTKVKAAFKWEKACQTVSDVKSQDSGIGGMQPLNYEVARYLRVPSTSDEHGVSPSDSGAAGISTPGTISSASSTEDVFSHGRHGVRDDSSDDDRSSFALDYIPNSKDEHSKSPTNKNHRTTWAKMKDIIQPRNSFKKSNRLSVKSDDFRVEDYTLSDEDVFEPKDSKSPLASPKCVKTPGELTPHFSFEVDCRSQQGNDEELDQIDQEKPENLTRLQEEIQKNYRELQTKLSMEFQNKMRDWERMKNSSSSAGTTSSTTTNLSPEDPKEQAFKKKMEEWEKIKGQPKHNMQLQSEEHLPLEFRKKLQEWQKIKRGATKDDQSSSPSSSQKKKLGEWPKWKSVSGHRSDQNPLESQTFSEDFIKKLEAWKQMKSNSYGNDEEPKDIKGNKTPSPKLMRKDGSGRQSKKIKEQTEKELQWFEKELGKIERDKQRLEREKQKFLEREERLAKLRRSVMGPDKQNILVQTKTGFHRFEGISRKFTQKLYEWEKAQGIGPEDSTFALLSSACVPTIITPNDPPPRLKKSKSADSVMNSDLNLTRPLLSEQPSSLSLNDMEALENECLLTNTASVPDMMRPGEQLDDEPEALIVEVEDIVEETACALVSFMDKKQTPVYQQQETIPVCEGATKATPAVQRSESRRAQNNYNFIEDTIDLLKLLNENENDIRFREEQNQFQFDIDDALQVETLKSLYLLQLETSSRLIEKLVRLQEANTKVTMSIVKEEGETAGKQMLETLESVQDLSVDILQLAEKLHSELLARNNHGEPTNSNHKYPSIYPIIHQQRSKILDLRRVLSYLCAASDATTPGKKKILQRNSKVRLRKSSSRETPPKIEAEHRDSDEELLVQIGQGAIKKRIRYRQKGLSSKALDESDDDTRGSLRKSTKKVQKSTIENKASHEEKAESKKEKPDPKTDKSEPKKDKTESKNDETDPKKDETDPNIKLDLDVIHKVAVPTKLNYMNSAEAVSKSASTSPVQVFVKTTRKLFTPLVTSSFATESRKGEVSEAPVTTSVLSYQKSAPVSTENQKLEQDATVNHLPPLPASPTPQRKASKDISPNIRLMLARYNQKIQEQDTPPCKSAGSSGSSSPIWRSPVTERRVKNQTEKYQQELMKLSPLTRLRGEVQKSASLGVVNRQNQSLVTNENPKSILKSSSACTLVSKDNDTQMDQSVKPHKTLCLKLSIPKENTPLSPESRSYKLQKAKEEFFNAPLHSPMSAPPMLKRSVDDENTTTVRYPERNRLSQISVGSESSYDDTQITEGILIKSASVGMISIDPETYRQINPEVHGGGYVSLPRNTKKQKEGLMSNIASKFRKVKMRRSKDPGKMNAVSTLCRQSLVVDINTGSQETLIADQASGRKESLTVPSESRGSSADTSPSSSRSGSWIKKPRLFKPKQ